MKQPRVNRSILLWRNGGNPVIPTVLEGPLGSQDLEDYTTPALEVILSAKSLRPFRRVGWASSVSILLRGPFLMLREVPEGEEGRDSS